MPDPSLSPAIIEARAVCPTDVFEIDTLEISHPDISQDTPFLDIAFIFDTSGSMEPKIATLRNLISDLATDLSQDFRIIRYALVRFESVAQTQIVTGPDFVDLETLIAAIDSLTVGGYDENGYGAIKLAAEGLPWVAGDLYARAIFLLTDDTVTVNNTTASRNAAIAALNAANISFSYGLTIPVSTTYTYKLISDATGGVQILNGTALEIREALVAQIQTGIVIGSGEGSIYIVNDTRAHSLPLVEGGDPVDFLVRGFKTRLTGSGENGLQNLSITIDDIDRKVSQFIKKAVAYSTPVELTFRVYLSDDLTKPQNNPPLILYITGANRDSEGMNVRASTIDVVNAPFPNQNYRLEHFPLQ